VELGENEKEPGDADVAIPGSLFFGRPGFKV
jgi:hypothetical protein